jgi:hypothetical protein
MPLKLITILLLIAAAMLPACGQTAIQWQRTGGDAPRLLQEGALYGRIVRLRNGDLLCSYEKAGKSYVKRSADEARTWSSETLAAESPVGSAANPELLPLNDGRVLLFVNERPRDGKSPFRILMVTSRDNGIHWSPASAPLYTADSDPHNGCWEPCARQMPDGEILLFFANESPYRHSDEQEITLIRSRDGARSWSAPETVIFRSRHRDGMPVPLLLSNGDLLIAIEDNGHGSLQPALIHIPSAQLKHFGPVGGESDQRVSPITPPLNPLVYAGAPYLCQMKGNLVLLSCQSAEGGHKQRMVVYTALPPYKQFGSPSEPFDLPKDVTGNWNSLFSLNTNTVLALSSTTINGTFGLWMAVGKAVALDGSIGK